MYFERQTGHICMSVAELCHMTCMAGDMDASRRRPSLHLPPSPQAIPDLAGIGEAGMSRVYLQHLCTLDGVTLAVSGLAELVTKDPQGGYVVSMNRPADRGRRLTCQLMPHEMAELCCYGHMLCAHLGLAGVTLQVKFVSDFFDESAKGSLRTFPMTAEELSKMYRGMLQEILWRAKDMVYCETTLRAKAKVAVFPYPSMRAAQEDMMRECLRDMRHGQTVFAQAPTGIGKTISTIYPALRCYGEGRCDKIFYLTAKASTRREGVSALERLVATGTPVRGVVLYAKPSLCVCPLVGRGHGGSVSRYCSPDTCPYAKGYAQKVHGVIASLLAQDKPIYTYADIKKAGLEGGVCPYELSLDLSEFCQVVICDYNYVFSPSVYLKRYFEEGIPKSAGHNYIFLVDEAHNLGDRARDMYSGYVSLPEVKALQSRLHDYESAMAQSRSQMIFPEEDDPAERCPSFATLCAKDLDDLVGELSRMADTCRHQMEVGADGVKCGAELSRQLPDVLSAVVANLSKRCQSFLRYHAGHPLLEAVESLGAILQAYVIAADHYDKNFATLVEVAGEDVTVRLSCLDPSSMLSPRLKWSVSGVFFSATLTPADYFADILGGDKKSVCVAFDSPFPKENLCVVVGDQISTRLEGRAKSYQRVVSYIAATVSARRGNYMVYFPSYEYMTAVQDIFQKKYPQVTLRVQTPSMTHEERDAFIHAFTGQTGKLQIGFCVLGGSFSEGLDLPGDALIGAIIVGVGIPGLSSERNIIKDYYDQKRDGEGYAYAYTYPGMNHVLQAAGRVIRRQEDRGVVVLLDDRYATPPYIQLFPEHWGNPRLASDPATLNDTLRAFWSGGK